MQRPHKYTHAKDKRMIWDSSFTPHTKITENGTPDIVRLLERRQAVLLDNGLGKDSFV